MSYTLRVNGKTLNTLNGCPIRQVIYQGVSYPLTNTPAEEPEGYILFSSPESFTLQVTSNANYEGQLQYNTTGEWIEVVKAEAIPSVNNQIKIRGIGNTYCSTSTVQKSVFVLSGNNIMCTGNIANLLDYETVLQGALPELGEKAFQQLFAGCSNLITSPTLPFTELAENCYQEMFWTSGLLVPPELPASILPESAYAGICAETPCQGYLDLRHVQEISQGAISYLGKNLICYFSPNLQKVTDATTALPLTIGDPYYTMYFFFTDDDEVLFTPENIIAENAGAKATATFNMYTDNTILHDAFYSRATERILVNVYHLDGTPWPPTEEPTEGGEE